MDALFNTMPRDSLSRSDWPAGSLTVVGQPWRLATERHWVIRSQYETGYYADIGHLTLRTWLAGEPLLRLLLQLS